ncbi:MAG: SoxR reducing system RseC family protein [Porticoccaceae bacterium]|jgi:sigma-E factor negative regulatory protein RseC|nr:SoxR reducing system RseC family protein [Porticoccaceae bacterium]MBT5576875.1 SoxR reducing system RseC family protein [Porticoccaceae bacterium]MBT7376376.1 SoxR reducing system RseC family protein [Porticoccaceae bacterium]
MIFETGTVVAVESDGLWVETIQKTACEACVAKKGCGTRVLSKLTGKTNRIRVLLNQQPADSLSVGQDVTIAIPEDVIVKGSMLVYLLPVVCALIGTWAVGSSGDLLAILGALSGLLFGGLIVSLRSKKTRNDSRLNPVLFDMPSDKQVLEIL